MSAMREAVAICVASLFVVATAGCQEAEFKGAAAEVAETNIKLDLPSVPQFDMPKPHADGSHPVREMRLKGNKFMDQEVRVKGYVVWIYDCATALRTPDMTDKDLERMLKDEPERCNRPNFRLGDTADTSPDKGVWVVDVPRPPREDEKKVLPKEMLAEWPEVPEFELGQELIVTGTWAQKSPNGFANTTGLLAYKSLVLANAPAEPAE